MELEIWPQIAPITTLWTTVLRLRSYKQKSSEKIALFDRFLQNTALFCKYHKVDF